MRLIKISIQLFSLAVFFSATSVAGQSSFDVYKQLTKRYSGKSLEIKADSLLNICDEQDDMVSKAEIAHEHAVSYVRSWPQDFSKALNYGLLEVSIYENEDITNESFQGIISPEIIEEGYARDSMYVRALYNAGRFYKDNSMYENAITIFEKIIKIDCTPLRTAQAHSEIGNCRSKLGDFFNAISFLKKGLALLTLLEPKDPSDRLDPNRVIINQLLNIALTYRNIGTQESFAKGLKALQKADSLQEFTNVSYGNYANLMNDLGNQYNSDNSYDFEKAYYYYQKSLDIGFERTDSSTISLALNNLANLYIRKQEDSTLYYIDKGLSFVIEGEIKARLFDTKSDYHLFRSELPEALNTIHKALEINIGKDIPLDKSPDILTLSNSDLKDYTIFCLKKKTEVLIRLFEKTSNRDFLIQAIQNVKAADELIDLIQSGSYESETKFLWRRAASEIYIKGVRAAQLLNQSEDIFYFIEKNKALLLSEEVTTNTAFTNLPANISNKTRELKKAILQLENGSTENNDALFNAKKHYQEFTDSIKLVYPAYFSRKVDIIPVGLSEWQQSLEPSTTLVSYIWNALNDETEALIGLAVDKNKAVSFAITNTDSLKAQIREYQKLVSRPLETNVDEQRFLELSASLFQQLFPTTEVQQMAMQKRLIIVPDGPLQAIPFEALITDNQSKKLLLQHTYLSYLYSVSFLTYNKNVDRQASKRFIAYAPIDFTNTSLDPLEKTREELSAIQNKVGGDMVYKEKATKAHFLKNSGAYSVMHLATHANATGNPWIAFADEKMQLHELYTYQNNADLITLSACNTLLGKVVSGEGVLSLSRGFFYSGAKSVMASLWNVDDQSTSKLMADFYANLNTGQTKSEALTNAKRNYLNTHSLSEQSPYYWSSIVLLGDSGHVDLSANYWRWYLLGFMIVGLALIMFFRKKPKN